MPTVWSDIMRVKKLRQEMEKVRLLLELIRKRERTKRELVCVGLSSSKTNSFLRVAGILSVLNRSMQYQVQAF